MKTNILIFIALCIMVGCKKTDSGTDTKYIRADIDKMDNISIFDIFDKIEVIPLETTDKSLISGISKVIVHDDVYYVLDPGFATCKLIAFDKQGKFLFNIDDKGQGPDEYLDIADFDIDKYNQRIILLSALGASLHEYDLNGNFLQKIKLPLIVSAYGKIKSLNKDTLVFSTYDYDNRMKFYSTNSNTIFKESQPGMNNVSISLEMSAFPFFNYNYFTKVLDNRVYELLPDGEVTTAYTWDFGNLNISDETVKQMPSLQGQEAVDYIKKAYASEVINYMFKLSERNSQYLYTGLIRDNKYINVFHNENRNKTYVFEKTKEGAALFPFCWTDDYVVGYAPFWRMFRIGLEEIIPDTILDEENILRKKQHGEEDNPVLIKYHFRKQP